MDHFLGPQKYYERATGLSSTLKIQELTRICDDTTQGCAIPLSVLAIIPIRMKKISNLRK